MSFDLDLQAVRTTAKKQLAPPCYPANAAKAANTANALQLPKVSNISRISSVSTLAGGAAKDSQAPEISSVSRVAMGVANVALPVVQAQTQAPAPDPGPARLLALAMALCDRTGASEKERQDWRADIEQTPPGLRGGLYAHLLGQLPPAPKAMPPAVVAPPDPAKPLPKFHVAQPWREADKAYQAHHWNCATCKAAARSGHSDRCATGQQLHDLYERAFEAGKVSK